MHQPSHQTVRLSRGRHATPEDGACVMELASMLAGEPFTDRPRSVCPVVASFLRTYNDRVDDDRRRDLYGVAAAVVGSRGDRALERARARRCVEIARLVSPDRLPWLRLLPRGQAARYAAAALSAADEPLLHRHALTLVDELVAMGETTPRVFRAVSETAPQSRLELSGEGG